MSLDPVGFMILAGGAFAAFQFSRWSSARRQTEADADDLERLNARIAASIEAQRAAVDPAFETPVIRALQAGRKPSTKRAR